MRCYNLMGIVLSAVPLLVASQAAHGQDQSLSQDERSRLLQERGVLHNQYSVHSAKGQFREALIRASKELDINRQLFGEDHRDLAVVHTNLGNVLRKLGDYKEAQSHYE